MLISMLISSIQILSLNQQQSIKIKLPPSFSPTAYKQQQINHYIDNKQTSEMSSKALLKINEYLRTLPRANSKQQTNILLNAIRNELPSLDKHYCSTYIILLIDFYLKKLSDTTNARQLCNKIYYERDPVIQATGSLKLSEIYYWQDDYSAACQELSSFFADQKYSQNKEIDEITDRHLAQFQKDQYFVQAYKLETQGKYKKALQLYKKQADSCSNLQKQRKYCALEAQKYVNALISRDRFDDNEMSAEQFIESEKKHNQRLNESDRQYLAKRQYCKMLLNYLQKHSQGHSNRFQRSFTEQKIKKIAINKIREILQNQKYPQQIESQLSELLQQLQSGQSISEQRLSFIKQFIREEHQQTEGTSTPRGLPSNIPSNMPVKPQFMNVTQSHLINFRGSKLTKVHASSDGFKTKYFYFKLKDMQNKKLKLYFTDKQSTKSKDDEYYDIRNLRQVIQGKNTKVLRKEKCEEFPADCCFALKTKDDTKNFIAPNRSNYDQWMRVFQDYLDLLAGKQIANRTLSNGPGAQSPLISRKISKNNSGNQSSNITGITKSKNIILT